MLCSPPCAFIHLGVLSMGLGQAWRETDGSCTHGVCNRDQWTQLLEQTAGVMVVPGEIRVSAATHQISCLPEF